MLGENSRGPVEVPAPVLGVPLSLAALTGWGGWQCGQHNGTEIGRPGSSYYLSHHVVRLDVPPDSNTEALVLSGMVELRGVAGFR